MPSLLTDAEKATLRTKMRGTASSPATLSDEMLAIAHELCAIHGDIRVTLEKSGIHFYMASPECLMQDGRTELTKKHLAVNVTKAIAGDKLCAMCMKTGRPYGLRQLLRMRPLADRGFPVHGKAKVSVPELDQSNLEPDANGNLVPKSPGTVVPLATLPAGHPALVYCTERRFDPLLLGRHYQAGFCTQPRTDVHYRRLGQGLCASPHGRLVLFIVQDGVVAGWQARMLELSRDGVRYLWHPEDNCWRPYAHEVTGAKPQMMDGWEDVDIPRYLFSRGGNRNGCIMGLDSAMQASQTIRDHRGRRFVILCEGPLTAARFIPHGVACMGKYLSVEQMDLLARRFDRVVYVPDNDKAGEESAASFLENMSAFHAGTSVELARLPSRINDAAELSPVEGELLVSQVQRCCAVFIP